MSISYGECETFNGSAANAAFNTVYQTGRCRGHVDLRLVRRQRRGAVRQSRYGKRREPRHRRQRLRLHALQRGRRRHRFRRHLCGTNSTYWNSTNTATYGSALSYIPEIPWNDSCASQLLAIFRQRIEPHLRFAPVFCNSLRRRASAAHDRRRQRRPKSRSTPNRPGKAACSAILPTACAIMPDVSLFAANGVWNHSYVFCWTDPNNDGIALHRHRPAAGHGAGRHLVLVADLGRHPGAGQPVHRVGAGQPQSRLLQDGQDRVRRQRQQRLQFEQRQHHRQLLHLLRRDVGRQRCRLFERQPQLLSAIGHLRRALDFDHVLSHRLTPAQSGWDFATGIGTVNVYNLVTNWASVGSGDAGLTVSVNGSGTVASNPAGISCPSTCGHDFAGGSQVTLTRDAGRRLDLQQLGRRLQRQRRAAP